MKHVKVISAALLLLALAGCAGCVLFQHEGEASWSTDPAQEEAQP